MADAQDNEYDLTTIEGLAKAIYEHAQGAEDLGTVEGTFCPRCGASRRMRLISLYWEDLWAPQQGQLYRGPDITSPQRGPDVPASDDPSPTMYAAVCVQCDHIYVLVVHPGPDGLEIAALPSSYGGLATPNTKPEVAYYLDQAHRARSVGALSGAAAMYRAALDQLLFHEGFTTGTLGPKIDALKAANPPPQWFAELGVDYLEVINWLGSGAIHPNDGTVEQQKAIDRTLTEAVDALFTEILYLVYERPHEKQQRLASVKKVAANLRLKGDS
jgi:hypothetical protein